MGHEWKLSDTAHDHQGSENIKASYGENFVAPLFVAVLINIVQDCQHQ